MTYLARSNVSAAGTLWVNKGELFEIKDFIAHSEDMDGVRKVLDNSKFYFMVSRTVKVTDGYKFQSAGIKVMEVYCDGIKTGVSFEVMVIDPASTGDLLGALTRIASLVPSGTMERRN